MRTTKQIMWSIVFASSVAMIVVGATDTTSTFQTKVNMVVMGIIAILISIIVCAIFRPFQSTTK